MAWWSPFLILVLLLAHSLLSIAQWIESYNKIIDFLVSYYEVLKIIFRCVVYQTQVSLCTLGWHHSIHIRTVTSQSLFSALLNLFKLVDGLIGKSSMHHTLFLLQISHEWIVKCTKDKSQFTNIQPTWKKCQSSGPTNIFSPYIQ